MSLCVNKQLSTILYTLGGILLVTMFFVALLFPNEGFAQITVEIPYDNSATDIVQDGDIIQSRANDLSFTNMIKLVNVYLWIAVIAVLMIMIIVAGFILITARGEPEKLKKANNILLNAAIGFGITLISYAIVQVVVNLF